MARPRLRPMVCEALESRENPAVAFQFDYSLDVNGFFNDPSRRAVLEQAGADLVSRIDTNLSAITPTGGRSWNSQFFHPATGQQTTLSNLNIPADTLVIYAGGRDLFGSQAGVGGSGGFSAGGDAAWLDTIATRGHTGYSLWGGSIAFDTGFNWNTSENAPASGQTDLYTVAVHELGHVLGFGTAEEYFQQVQNGFFIGAAATAANGGNAPQLSSDGAHWMQGTRSTGCCCEFCTGSQVATSTPGVVTNQPASLNPVLISGTRYGFTELDYGVLSDIGWSISAAPTSQPGETTSPPVVTQPISPTPTPTPTPTPILTPTPVVPVVPFVPVVPPSTPITDATRFLSISGGVRGATQLYQFNGNTTATVVGGLSQAFPGFNGTVRTATVDLNGDSVPELISVTGPGGGSRVRVTNGLTGADFIPTFSVFESGFTGGLYVAAADVDGDGRPDLIVSPDRGGGGRVTVYSLANQQPRVIANFFGIDDANFRGGARVAAADINNDGRADLIVGAGFGGGPRVAIFDGATLTQPSPRRLVPDFFAFGGADATTLRNGVFISAGDLNGDGFADLAFGGGPGGGPRVLVLDGAKLSISPAVAQASPSANFFGFDPNQRGGVRPAIRDVDGDGRSDLVLGSGENTLASVKIYSGATSVWSGGTPSAGQEFLPFGALTAADGIFVG